MIITPILVVFLVIVFTLTFLFVNTIDKRKWITIPLSLILTPFLYFYAFYPMINIFSSYHHQKYFDSELFMENPSFRYEMYDNIEASDTLLGKSKDNVIEMLGDYEWLTWDYEKDDFNENSWNYGMGIWPGAFNTQSEVLKIIFKDDKVIKVKSFKQDIKYDEKE